MAECDKYNQIEKVIGIIFELSTRKLVCPIFKEPDFKDQKTGVWLYKIKGFLSGNIELVNLDKSEIEHLGDYIAGK